MSNEKATEYADMRGDLYIGTCKKCGKALHFLDGDAGHYWMVCDACLHISCESKSQDETLTAWARASIEKDCFTCAHRDTLSNAGPCLDCDGESAWVRLPTTPTPDDHTARAFHMLKATNPKDAIGTSKAPMSTVPAAVLAEVGVAMLEGACKYGRSNFRIAGVRASVYYDAAMRHLMAWWEGEDTDPDSGMSHITKAVTSLVVLRDAMIQGMCTDDRPPRSAEFYARLNTLAAEVRARHADKSPRHYTIADSK